MYRTWDVSHAVNILYTVPGVFGQVHVSIHVNGRSIEVVSERERERERCENSRGKKMMMMIYLPLFQTAIVISIRYMILFSFFGERLNHPYSQYSRCQCAVRIFLLLLLKKGFLMVRVGGLGGLLQFE